MPLLTIMIRSHTKYASNEQQEEEEADGNVGT